MPDEPQIEKQSKLLVVSLELFRRSFADTMAFVFANRDRGNAAPEWARQAIQPPDSPAAARHGQDLYQPQVPPPVKVGKPIPLAQYEEVAGNAPTFNLAPQSGKPDLPSIPLARPPAETYGLEKPTLTGGFGLGGDKASTVSAFDRPQSVFIVGPNPLPVTMDLSKISGRDSRPTEPRDRRRPDEGGALSVAKAIGMRFLAVLGPLYALSTVLQQTNSGVGVFGKAVNVLGATLAPLLLPVFAMLAAGVLSLSDYIWGKLLPALGDFYEWALKFGAVVQDKVEKAADTIDTGVAVKNFFTKGELPKLEDMPKHFDSALRNIDPTGSAGVGIDKIGGAKDFFDFAGRNFFGGKSWKDSVDKARGNEAIEGEKPKEKFDFGANMSANMRDVLRSLAMSMGPKASYASLGEVGRQAQLAALNADPIEMKAAQRVIQSIQEFQKAWEESQRKRDADNQLNRREPNRLLGERR